MAIGPNKTNLKIEKLIRIRNDRTAKEIYRNAFPKIEQLPYWFLKVGSIGKSKDFFVFLQENMIKAIAFFVVDREFALLYYFAVDESLRGTGIGSESLSLLKEYYDIPLLVIMKPLDSDANDYKQRERRRAFYERAGFSSAGMTVTDWSGSFSVFSTAGRPDAGRLYSMLKKFTPWDKQLVVTEDHVYER